LHERLLLVEALHLVQVEEAGEQLEADAALAVELLLAGDAGAAEVGAGLVHADVDLEDVVDAPRGALGGARKDTPFMAMS
jgi:hypothetical protein